MRRAHASGGSLDSSKRCPGIPGGDSDSATVITLDHTQLLDSRFSLQLCCLAAMRSTLR